MDRYPTETVLPVDPKLVVFVEKAYKLIYPFSNFDKDRVTHLEAIRKIKKQLDVLCGKEMNAVMVVIASALEFELTKDDNARSICARLRVKLDEAERVFTRNRDIIRRLRSPQSPRSPTRNHKVVLPTLSSQGLLPTVNSLPTMGSLPTIPTLSLGSPRGNLNSSRIVFPPGSPALTRK